MTALQIIFNFLLLLQFRIISNVIIIGPKFLQLIDPMLQHIVINLHKIGNLIPILTHKDTHQQQILQPECGVMNIIHNAIEYL